MAADLFDEGQIVDIGEDPGGLPPQTAVGLYRDLTATVFQLCPWQHARLHSRGYHGDVQAVAEGPQGRPARVLLIAQTPP